MNSIPPIGSNYKGILPYADFISVNFITAISQKIPKICLMRILGYFISVVQFFGQK